MVGVTGGGGGSSERPDLSEIRFVFCTRASRCGDLIFRSIFFLLFKDFFMSCSGKVEEVREQPSGPSSVF